MLKLVQPVMGDEAFLLELYAGSREEEMRYWGWSGQEKREFLAMQYRFQLQSYKMKYPEADHYVIQMDNLRIGRLIVARTEVDIIIVDISLVAGCRNRGLGTRVIEMLQQEAKACLKPLVLRVQVSNPARNLYERLGFRITQQSDLLYHMEWLWGDVFEK